MSYGLIASPEKIAGGRMYSSAIEAPLGAFCLGTVVLAKSSPAMNPMNTFNPEIPCHVHNRLNDEILEWQTQWAPLFRELGILQDEGVIAWNGFLLDGWSTIVQQGIR